MSDHPTDTPLMEASSTDAHKDTPRGRVIPVILILVPALLLVVFQIMARPDPEYWLSQQTKGFSRSDAFDGVTNILPVFSTLFGITSLFGAFCIARQHAQYLIPLSVGPILAGMVYLIMHGVTDPAWFTLLALLTIGMLVGSPVTVVWMTVIKKAT